MVTSCVPKCKQISYRYDPGIAFHQFPSDSPLRDLWVRNITRENLVINDRLPSTFVCSKHFTPEDYLSCGRQRRLRKCSVPTVFKRRVTLRR
ncbi:hypothetical protein HPB47_003548 [Ixodes persulcatus]|uniref:Uncharacterized protein n=1 Tax=Ixodes persulcatus TaxID=34615 RepID=A0AC60PIM5_IXOPE|nr:hypothetical protein HPB47_003548 [Ixodes persulcatus]